MAERRPLSAAFVSPPDTDPEAVRQFVTQERRTPVFPQTDFVANDRAGREVATFDPPAKRRRGKTAGITPVGLIPVTVRLRPEVAGALKRASLERQLRGEDSFTQQELVEQALEPWLRAEGLL